MDSTVSSIFPQALYKRQGLYRTEPAYRISGKEEDIQWEILTNGPVQGETRWPRSVLQQCFFLHFILPLTGILLM